LFEELARALKGNLGGDWTEQLNGPDQRYWDLRVGNGVITLHLEHYLGISIFPASDSHDQQASTALIEKAYVFLSNYEHVA